MNPSRRKGWLRRALATALPAILLFALAAPAGARPARYWQYERNPKHHRPWARHALFQTRHDQWHAAHLTFTEDEHGAVHRDLRRDHMRRHHFYRSRGVQRGRASWFDYDGDTGACGVRLTGMYAAHRTLPCGTRVSVKRGSRYVIVTIKDRGPFVNGWILDLAPAAFRRLAPIGAGVIDVSAYRLRKR